MRADVSALLGSIGTAIVAFVNRWMEHQETLADHVASQDSYRALLTIIEGCTK